MDIAIVGTGYVGLVSGVCLAEIGHRVVAVDVDTKKVAQLRSGQSPIYEPGLEPMIARNIEHERLSFTTDLATALTTAEMTFIAVGTPQGEDGSADLQYVMNVAEEIADKIDRDCIVVVKSTVPVGTCDQVEQTISARLKARRKNVTVRVASNPEFLKEGAAISDFMKPDRIIVGVNDSSIEPAFRRLYRPFVLDDPGRLMIMDRRSSELSKYGANAMLATRISFMNELAQLCEIIGADIDNVRRGLGSDPRIGRKFLYAGPGFGGSCFPKDVKALQRLAMAKETTLSIVDAAWKANLDHIRWIARKVIDHFDGDLSGKTIGLWGLAFKPGTDDIREAPSLYVVRDLIATGARVVGHDPKAAENFAAELKGEQKFQLVGSAYQAADGVDALVLMTEWSEYRRPNWEKVAAKMAGRVMFDFRNQYDEVDLKDAGFMYYSVGRAGG